MAGISDRPRWMGTSRTRILFALAWLVCLTFANRSLDGCLRSSLLYIVPVAAVAYDSMNMAIVFAGLTSLSAWVGGAIPSAHSLDPTWMEGLWAFSKLSVGAVAARGVFAVRKPFK